MPPEPEVSGRNLWPLAASVKKLQTPLYSDGFARDGLTPG
jgi:hypothetical protein